MGRSWIAKKCMRNKAAEEMKEGDRSRLGVQAVPPCHSQHKHPPRSSPRSLWHAAGSRRGRSHSAAHPWACTWPRAGQGWLSCSPRTPRAGDTPRGPPSIFSPPGPQPKLTQPPGSTRAAQMRACSSCTPRGPRSLPCPRAPRWPRSSPKGHRAPRAPPTRRRRCGCVHPAEAPAAPSRGHSTARGDPHAAPCAHTHARRPAAAFLQQGCAGGSPVPGPCNAQELGSCKSRGTRC